MDYTTSETSRRFMGYTARSTTEKYEGSGPIAYDSSGNGNYGAVRGATWVAGRYRGALEFNGAERDYVRVRDSRFLDITDNITVAAWVYIPQRPTTHRVVIAKYVWAQNQGYVLKLEPSTTGFRVTFALGNGGTTHYVCYYRSFTAGWFHLAGTYDGATQKLYVNGGLVNDKAWRGSIATNNSDLLIGAEKVGWWHFDGVIDEVRVYNCELGEEEIKEISGIGEGDFEISLSEDEVVLVDGQASLTVTLSSAEGFNGDVLLSVGDPIPGVDAPFSPNPVDLVNSASSTLTLQLDGSPSQVKNTVRVVASSLGRTTREASFMLYAFGDSWIGVVELDRQPAYDDHDEVEDSGGLIHSADAFAPLWDDSGYVYANTNVAIWGGAKAHATQLVYFPPEQSGPVTVEAKLQVRSLIVTEAELLGISHGETVGHVYLDGERHLRQFEEEWAFDVPVALIPYVGEIYVIVKGAVDTTDILMDLVEIIVGNGGFEERVVKYTWDVNSGQTYKVGGGVSSDASAMIIAAGNATVVGYVDSIKVWRGTMPLIEYKFNYGSGDIAYDTSGLNLNASIADLSWASGLTSGALDFNGSDYTGVSTNFSLNDLWNFEGVSFEAWVKPRQLKNASIITFYTTGLQYNEFDFWQGITEDGEFHFEGSGPLCLGRKVFKGGLYETDKEWYHVVGTYSPEALWSFFVDGVLIGADSGQGFSLDAEDVRLNGGRARLGGWEFNGLIEEIKLYPRALSGDEIGARYKAGPSL